MNRLLFLSSALVVLNASLGLGDDWPGWRGADRSDVSRETGLLKQWPEGGPKQVWHSAEGGMGYSGFAVVGGRLYTIGAYSDTEDLVCMDANTGKIKWLATISNRVLENGWGDGPRGTPAVDGDRIYAMGGQGDLICAQAAKGEILWTVKMQDLGGRVPNWGYTESVLVDGDRVICTPGGRNGAIAALDKLTGKVVWQSKDFTDSADYSSVIVAEHNGKRQYIQLTQRSVVGIAADDGSVLWRSDWPGRTAVIPTPIYHDGHVYATSGYGVGCELLKLTEEGAESVYKNQDMKNQHGGVVLVGDFLYGYSDNVGWLCQRFLTGEKVWAERQALGKGSVTCADVMLYCLTEDQGIVALVEATPDGFSEKGRFTLDPQSEIRSSRGKIWTHPVIANGKLYLRDQEHIFCYDVKGE